MLRAPVTSVTVQWHQLTCSVPPLAAPGHLGGVTGKRAGLALFWEHKNREMRALLRKHYRWSTAGPTLGRPGGVEWK